MMYLVYYSSGSYDTAYEWNVFVTADEQMARAYTEKFNHLLDKWKAYCIENILDTMWDENSKYDWHKWNRIMETSGCTYQMINVR
jgi:hypothetical protein